ncbi:MAG: hypothetical protein RSE12_17005 [Fuscovulum sp.]|nr:MAG: hypothetical protein RSE12_17005 [Fuscovulum sp.]
MLFAAGDVGWFFDNTRASLFPTDPAVNSVLVGQGIALQTGRALGVNRSQPNAGARPLYAEHPASGVRNFVNGSADPGNNAVWVPSATSNGVTITRVASGIDADGLPYADYTVVGTATAVSFISALAHSASRVAARPGQQFTTSFRAQVIAGTVPPVDCGVRAEMRGETAPAADIEGSASVVFRSTTEGVVSHTLTLAAGTTNQARGTVVFRTISGATVNYTARVKAVQFERGPFRTNYQFNYARHRIEEPGFAQVGHVLYDGVDDFMQTPALAFAGKDKVTVCTAIAKISDAGRASALELGAGPSPRFNIEAPDVAGRDAYAFGTGSSTVATVGTAGFPAPDTAVVTGIGDISGDVSILRRNGLQIGQTAADQGTGTYQTAPVFFGRRGGTSFPFNGREYASFGISRLLSAGELAQLEAWMTQRIGGIAA